MDGWLVDGHAGVWGDSVARCGFSGIMLLVFPLLPAKFLSLPRVNRILAKTIIHLSFFHSLFGLFGPFFAGLDF